jgi:hypothetical protein
VITTDIFLEKSIVHERIDNNVYVGFAEACNVTRELNEAYFNHTITALKSKPRFKVFEIADTVPHGSRRGRTAEELLDIAALPVDHLQKAVELQEVEDSAAVITADPWAVYLSNGYLSLRSKDIAACDVPAILDICSQAEGRVTQLGLSDNRLLGDGTQLLTSGLLNTSYCSSICCLFLSDNNIGDDGATAIAHLINSRALPLVKLGLNSNCITDVGVRALADALRSTPTAIVSEGCAAAEACCPLTVLGLSRNEISTEGAVYLADALSTNIALKRLFLNYNPSIGDKGGLAVSRAAQHHPTLERLGVAFCGLESASGLDLISVIDSSHTIERICVSGNKFCASTEIRMKEIPLFNFAAIK